MHAPSAKTALLLSFLALALTGCALPLGRLGLDSDTPPTKVKPTEPLDYILANGVPGLDLVPQVDFETLITLHSAAEIEARRTRLIDFIFGQPSLPHPLLAARPEPHSKRIQAYLADWESYPREFLSLQMDYGLASNLLHIHAGGDGSTLIIFHAGHGDLFLGERENVIQFLQAGYDILFVSLPLTGINTPAVGPNPPAFADTECCGEIEFLTGIEGHAQFEYLPHPLKYFFEPLAAAVDYAFSAGYQRIAMVGISGGGWATVVYAAIDPRVSASFSVAGSLPLWMRIPEYEPGDFEQRYPPFYQLADYLDLYLMGAFGADRSQLLIYNYFDPCCYGGERALLFLEPVRTRLDSFGSGSFDIYIDRSHFYHMISPEAVDLILARLAAGD